MQELTADSFELASCQAVIFTPDGDLAVSKIMKDLYASLAAVFDGDPTVLPPLPEGAPAEIPRIILESASHEWRCEVSPARVGVSWQQAQDTDNYVELDDFFGRAADILLQFVAKFRPRVACGGPRLADSGLGSTYATLEAGALTASYCSGVR